MLNCTGPMVGLHQACRSAAAALCLDLDLCCLLCYQYCIFILYGCALLSQWVALLQAVAPFFRPADFWMLNVPAGWRNWGTRSTHRPRASIHGRHRCRFDPATLEQVAARLACGRTPASDVTCHGSSLLCCTVHAAPQPRDLYIPTTSVAAPGLRGSRARAPSMPAEAQKAATVEAEMMADEVMARSAC